MSDVVSLPCQHSYGTIEQETSRTAVYREVRISDTEINNVIDYIDVKYNILCARCGASMGSGSRRG